MGSTSFIRRRQYVFTSLLMRLDSVDISRPCSAEKVRVVVVTEAATGAAVAVFAQGDVELDAAVQEYLEANVEDFEHRLGA